MLGNPEYGCLLIERVFMYGGVLIDDLIKDDIINAVNKFEPRIIMHSNDIQVVIDNRVLRIYIQYYIKDSGQINSYNLELTDNDNPYK